MLYKSGSDSAKTPLSTGNSTFTGWTASIVVMYVILTDKTKVKHLIDGGTRSHSDEECNVDS